MRRFVITVALTWFLSGSALAGDIPTVGVTAPPPPTPTAPGDVPSVGFVQQISVAALDLAELVFSAVI